MAEILKLPLLTALVLLLSKYGFCSVNRVSIWVDGNELVSDLTLDWGTNTSIIYFPNTKVIYGFPTIPTVNLHDYNNGWLAYKNINSGICLLKHLEEEMKEMYDLLQQFKQGKKHSPPTEYASINETEIPKSEILAITGERISDFCSDYKSHWLVPVDRLKRTSTKDKETPSHKHKRCWISCYHCFVQTDMRADMGNVAK